MFLSFEVCSVSGSVVLHVASLSIEVCSVSGSEVLPRVLLFFWDVRPAAQTLISSSAVLQLPCNSGSLQMFRPSSEPEPGVCSFRQRAV